jgi:hypothetical protein
MVGESKKVTNHQVIKKWVEERGGIPARVKETSEKGEGVGVLRIDFPGYGENESLEHISWEKFFNTFEKKKLAVLLQ